MHITSSSTNVGHWWHCSTKISHCKPSEAPWKFEYGHYM